MSRLTSMMLALLFALAMILGGTSMATAGDLGNSAEDDTLAYEDDEWDEGGDDDWGDDADDDWDDGGDDWDDGDDDW